MAKEWDEVMLWALAEELSTRMDAVREQGAENAKKKQRELDLGPGGNIIDFVQHHRRRAAGAGRVQLTGTSRGSTAAGSRASTDTSPGGRRSPVG